MSDVVLLRHVERPPRVATLVTSCALTGTDITVDTTGNRREMACVLRLPAGSLVSRLFASIDIDVDRV